MLKFSNANAKIEALSQDVELSQYLTGKRKVYSLDLLSGYSCPFANECLSKAVQENGTRKIKDGPNTQFRCFSASQEVLHTNVYNLRKHNFETLRRLTSDEMKAEITASLPKNAGIVRIHVAGDFFSRDYMKAWRDVAESNPNTLFYAYTKSIRYWLSLRDSIPHNFVLTASYGGRDDSLIESENLRFSKVIYHPSEAEKLGLEIDHTDAHAAKPSCKDISFSLLLHGTQPKESEASRALKILKNENVQFSYSRK